MKNSKVVGVYLPIKVVGEVERRAKALSLSTSKFCEIILCRFIASGEKLSIVEKP